MPTYRCKIAGSDGKVYEKTVTARSKSSLKIQMEGEGNFVFWIKRPLHDRFVFPTSMDRGRFSQKEFLSFNQEFSVLIRAGLPIVSALDAIIEKDREDGELITILGQVRADVASGESLADAFGKFSNNFSELYVTNIRAGEKSGSIPQALERYIGYLKKTDEIRKKVVSASVYPLILTIVSISVLSFLLIYVVPSISSTFFESGTKLPWMTIALVDFSTAIRENIFYIVSGITLVIAGLYSFKKTDSGGLVIDRFKLGIYFFGELYINYNISKLSRTLSTVIKAGLPLVDSVKISISILNNQLLQKGLREAVKNIEQGDGFAESLSKIYRFPKLAMRMIAAGESGGALPQVLNDVADFYEGDVDSKLLLLTSSIEPALMIIMGFLIGFMVLALYLPIFQLAGTIG